MRPDEGHGTYMPIPQCISCRQSRAEGVVGEPDDLYERIAYARFDCVYSNPLILENVVPMNAGYSMFPTPNAPSSDDMDIAG